MTLEVATTSSAATSAKEAIARAIRRRNGLQASSSHSQQRSARTNRMYRANNAALDITRKLSFSTAVGADPVDSDDSDDNDDSAIVDPNCVQIVIRIRPLATDASSSSSSTVVHNNDSECFRVVSQTAMVAQPPKTSQAYRSTGTATAFQFSRIFSATTAQRDLFNATTKPVLRAAFRGQSGLVFAYGVTNSGKTYTISGTPERPGVLPQALAFVVDELARSDKENAEETITRVTASYVEVYNENVFDLLATAPLSRKRRALRLQDCDGSIQVKGLLEKPLRTIADCNELLALGLKNKQVAETRCNADSSRSHCVFTLQLYSRSRRAERGGGGGAGSFCLQSKVSIVDLAGSERSSKTGATGLRQQEASKINASLMNLMRCIETLRWNQQHAPALHKMVPFRESKLTRLFQENLVGKASGPLVMIVAVNPSSHEFDETLRTLKYSAVTRELVPATALQPTASTTTTTATTTRAQTRRANAGSAFVYDLDGRLTKKPRLSIDGTTQQSTVLTPLRRNGVAISERRSATKSTTTVTTPMSRTASVQRSTGKRNAVQEDDDEADDEENAAAAVMSAAKRVNGVVQQSTRFESVRPAKRLSSDGVVVKSDGATDDPVAFDDSGAIVKSTHHQQSLAVWTRTPPLPLVNDDASMLRLQIACTALELRVTELEVENDDLRRQLSSVNAEQLELEVRIRNELGQQMHAQLQQIRAQYQLAASSAAAAVATTRSTTSARNDPVPTSSAINRPRRSSRQASATTDTSKNTDATCVELQRQVTQLQEQLNECEDEMERVRKRHEVEVAALRGAAAPLPIKSER